MKHKFMLNITAVVLLRVNVILKLIKPSKHIRITLEKLLFLNKHKPANINLKKDLESFEKKRPN